MNSRRETKSGDQTTGASFLLEWRSRNPERRLAVGAKCRPPARLRRAAGCLLEQNFSRLAEDEIYCRSNAFFARITPTVDINCISGRILGLVLVRAAAGERSNCAVLKEKCTSLGSRFIAKAIKHCAG